MIESQEYQGGAVGDECPPRDQWITLDEAIYQGLRLDFVAHGIGPRRVGTVYRGGYWGDVSTVTKIMVKVGKVRRRDRFVTAAVSWEITEYHANDVRDRTHMTSWHYPEDLHGRPDQVLIGPGDTRPRSERSRSGR